MLWWRVVGVTDRILHAKIDDEERNAEIEGCNKEVYRLVPDNSANFQQEFNNFDGRDDGLDNNDDETDLFKKVTLQNKNKEIGHIRAEPELNLTLMRHWTLYDSLQNSNYISLLKLAKPQKISQ